MLKGFKNLLKMNLEIDLEKDKGNIFPPFLFLNSACWPFFFRRPG